MTSYIFVIEEPTPHLTKQGANGLVPTCQLSVPVSAVLH